MTRRFFFLVCLILVVTPLAQLFVPSTAFAAASLSVGGPTSIKVGDTVNVTILVNASQSANAFQGNFSYPSGLFEAVRGTYSGSICTLPITQPEPDGGAASFSCGRPSGFSGSGTVATIVLKAVSAGSGSFGLSGCQVLANDGQGTDITGGCSGRGVTVSDVAVSATPTPSTPTPATPTPQQSSSGSTNTGGTTSSTPKPTATPKTSPTPTASPKVTPTPSQTPVAAETPKPAESTPEPTPPPVQALTETPTPSATIQAPQTDSGENTESSQPRTIAQAIQDILASTKDLKNLHSSPAGVIALMVTTIPFLALTLAILFLAFRLYTMERRRRNTLDRLFEMELSELAALEGKLDLLAEKGTKGREQYREEFKHAKENILRQLKPNYGKAVNPEPKAPTDPEPTPKK